jgi:hypothetical protein
MWVLCFAAEVIAPVYARMAQKMAAGEKHILLMAMQGFFETLEEAKERVDASLGDLFCEESGRMRMLPFLQVCHSGEQVHTAKEHKGAE